VQDSSSGQHVPPDNGNSLKVQPRIIVLHQLTGAELDQLYEFGLTKVIDLTIASGLFGALIAFGIWLLTVGANTPVQVGAAIGGLSTLVPLFLFFSIRACQNYRRAKDLLACIKGGNV